ncbi:MAG: DNA polymerase I [Candidatus Omnitrophota bacterium]
MPVKRLYLLDATSFCYRAFYAVRNLSTSYGQPTGAIYGFINIINKILKEGRPDYLAVCFDVSGDTFRSRKFADYKIQRPKMPDELASQIPLIKEIVLGFGFKIVEEEGFEADDIIASIAKRAASNGFSVTIVSSDKDMLQLVSDDISVFNPYKGLGLLYDKKEVTRYFGVLPEQIPDLLSLAGDDADNIPGVPGVGEKTAVKLILKFGSLENILNRLSEIESEKTQRAIKENIDRVRLNKELIFLSGDLKAGLDLEALKIEDPDLGKLSALFKRLEFKKFLLTIKPKQSAVNSCQAEEYKDRESGKVLEGIRELFISADDGTNLFIYIQGKKMLLSEVGPNLKKILSDPKVKKIGHNLKKVKVVLGRRGVVVNGTSFDLMVAAYLLNPSKPDYSLDSIVFEFLGTNAAVETLSQHKEAHLVKMLVLALEKELKDKGLFKLFKEVEMPLVDVLAGMEIDGVRLDLKLLASLSKELEKKLKYLMRDIYKLSDAKFNINSPKQLSNILFEKLNLPVIKRTKTGPSTDEEVLSKLAKEHKLPGILLEYRQLAKLKTTYIDPLPLLVDSTTGRLHASFNQCVTETGRLSSSNPNLQNIPIRTQIGGNIRRSIIASDKDSLLLSCDYSQIELRVLAHLSKDGNLIEAFRRNKDIHKITAGLIYGVEEKDTTEEMRDTAKRVNFGILYGLTSFGLSRDLNISIDEAQAFIDAYFSRYPKVKDYIEEGINIAEEKGFVTTILGRRRYIPQIHSKNIALRQFARRQAVNTPIQGSASDLIKLAMVNIQEALTKKSFKARLVLQVHDELLFDLPKEELSFLLPLVKDKMENALELDVPVVVDMKQGDNWLEMESV